MPYKRINSKSLHSIPIDKILMEFGFVTFCGWFDRSWQVKDRPTAKKCDEETQ